MRRPFAVLFCFAAIAACGDTEDPFPVDVSSQADVGSDAVDSPDATLDVQVDIEIPDVTGDGEQPDTVGSDVENDVPVADTTSDATADAVEDVVTFPCGDDVVFTGQAFVSSDEPASSPNGGIPSFVPYAADYDSGIAAIVGAMPEGQDPATVEIQVTGATIVATSFNNETARRAQNTFWLMDGQTMLEVRLDQDDVDAQPPFAVKVGLQIDFTATSVSNYFGTPQLAAGTDWAISEGADGNAPVYFFEPGPGETITFADWPTNLRVTGTITGGGEACGGSSLCWALDYGGEATIELRSNSSFIEVGDCLTFAGPLNQFNGLPQLTTTNFSWLFEYRRN